MIERFIGLGSLFFSSYNFFFLSSLFTGMRILFYLSLMYLFVKPVTSSPLTFTWPRCDNDVGNVLSSSRYPRSIPFFFFFFPFIERVEIDPLLCDLLSWCHLSFLTRSQSSRGRLPSDARRTPPPPPLVIQFSR